MAQVRDRAQLILVAGLALAVLFVVLALLVNTAIYTENVATRGVDPGGEALEYRGAAVTTVGGLIDAENAHGGHDNVTAIEEALEDGIGEVDESLHHQFVRRGAATRLSASAMGVTEGTLIRETNVSEFEDWTAEINRTRAFSIDFEPDEMSETGEPANEAFRIELDDRKLYVYVEEGGDGLVVATEDDPEESICRVDDWDENETIRFDVTAQRFDGEPCRFGWPDPDEITFANGENAAGAYSLTVEPPEGTDLLDIIEDLTEDVDLDEAVYSLDGLTLRYDSKAVSYETTVRVAPGEPND